MILSLRLVVFLLVLSLAGLPAPGWSEPGHSDEGEHHQGVHLDEAQREAAGITLAVAAPGEVRDSIQLLGEVKVDQTRLARVVPRVSGIATEVPRLVGDRVEPGEVLAVLESAELGTAKIALVSAVLNFELARLDLERQETIFENTRRMLEVLHGRPPLEKVRRQVMELEIGEDKGKLLEAYSRLSFARASLDRERELFEQQISSQQVFQEAQRDFEVAEAQFEAAEETVRFGFRLARLKAKRAFQLADNELHNARRKLLLLGATREEIAAATRDHLGKDDADREGDSPQPHSLEVHQKASDFDRRLAEFTLRSPFAGQVLSRRLSLGERVTPEDTPFVIGDLASVWVDLSVYPRDLARVRPGLAVEIQADGVDQVAKAEIAFVQPILSERVRTATCRVLLPNPEGVWRPGLFVSARVFLAGRPARVVIPRSAVIRRGEQVLAFALDEEELVPRPVTLGREDAENVEVLSGLDPGERFAATGVFVLKAELARETLGEAGHSH